MATKVNIQTCTEDDVAACLNADLVKTSKTIFSIQTFDLPVSDVAFDAFFGPEIVFFAGPQNTRSTGAARSTNTTNTNAVDMPFLARCITLYITVEPLGFTVAGGAFTTPTPGSKVPYFDGVQVETAQGNALTFNPRPAWLEWGLGTWKAAHAIMQAYRMEMMLGNRLQLFSELGVDVGSVDSHSEWVGFSNSLTEIPQYVALVNARQAEADINRGLVFLPPTAQTIVPPGETTVTAKLGVPTPLVPASWGGPSMAGMFCNGCYPLRGILFVPGMPITLNLVRDDDTVYYNALKRALTQASNLTYDANYDGAVVFNNAQIASTVFQEFKGGKLRIGIAMRGFELTPRAAVEWYGTWGYSYGQPYMVAAAANLVDQMSTVGVGQNSALGGGGSGLEMEEWLALGAPEDWSKSYESREAARQTARANIAKAASGR
jgi:hypothetical protein